MRSVSISVIFLFFYFFINDLLHMYTPLYTYMYTYLEIIPNVTLLSHIYICMNIV